MEKIIVRLVAFIAGLIGVVAFPVEFLILLCVIVFCILTKRITIKESFGLIHINIEHTIYALNLTFELMIHGNLDRWKKEYSKFDVDEKIEKLES